MVVPVSGLGATGAEVVGVELGGGTYELTGLDEGGRLEDGCAVLGCVAVGCEVAIGEGVAEEADSNALVGAVEALGAAVHPAISRTARAEQTALDTPVRIRMDAKTARPAG
jgi:hypothetical protein